MQCINKIGLVGLLVLASIGTSAAQQPNSAFPESPLKIPRNEGLIISSKSMPERVNVDISHPRSRRVLAAHREELPVGSVIYENNGKLYIVNERDVPQAVLIFDQGHN
jgi:hypothetical protein